MTDISYLEFKMFYDEITTEDSNGFFYTNDTQIKKMDDDIIIAKIVEKYPDFEITNSENILKQAFMVVLNDYKLIESIIDLYDITQIELMGIIYKKYSHIFSKCFITKISKNIKHRYYAKRRNNS